MRSGLFLAIPLAFLSAACTYDNGDARRIPDDIPPGAAGSTGATGGTGGTGGTGAVGGTGAAGGTSGPVHCGPATPVQTWIDVDAQIETQPGEGVGVFIEYAKGGHWVLRTTCDTLKSNTPCAWDIIVTPEDGRSISNVQPEGLESGTDSVSTYPEYPRSYQLLAETRGDFDGFSFDTEPQSGISFDVFLDGACALPFIFWVGDGALHEGSPSNPLELVPTPE